MDDRFKHYQNKNTQNFSPLSSFIAGALIPTIAYFLLLRRQNKTNNVNDNIKNDDNVNANENINFEDENGFDDDSSDDGFEPIERIEGDDPTSWGMMDAPYKMVLCVNQELNMGKGKIAAQCSHAAVGCYKKAIKSFPSALRAWELTGCAKIAVKCPSEAEMMNDILVKAAQAGIPYYFVEDAGRTQIAAGSRTVLGLGPAPVRVFEGITSHLKLM